MGKPSVLFESIAALEAQNTGLTVTDMCALAGVSRSGYYGWKDAEEARKAREQKDREDFDLILQVYNKHGYSKGVKSIHMGLLHQDPPVLMNVKKIRRLMRKYRLVCPLRKPNPYKKMAKALEESTVAPNVLRREFEAYGPRSVLLTDITYLQYGEGRTAYLSTIEDAYTKEILAWEVSESLEVCFVIRTLDQLNEKHGNELAEAVVVHSDQGSHYKSCAFREALGDRDFIQSMSRKANCWDNQPMEYFFGSLKDHERRLFTECGTFEEVCTEVERFMDYYNNYRCQWKLAKLAPAEYYRFCMTGEYPLQVENPPDMPQAPKTSEDLLLRAAEAAEKARKGAGAEASDSTLDKPPDKAAQSGQRLPE